MDILVKDLKVFAAFNEDLFKEITQLLTLDNFRYGLNVLGIIISCEVHFLPAHIDRVPF